MFWDYNAQKSSESFRQDIYCLQNHWTDFILETFCLIKNIFIKKNLTDFRKTVETAVDSHLLDNPNSIPRLSVSRFSRPLTSKEQHSPT